MEISKVETKVLEKLLDEVQNEQLRSLTDLQLALVGGGIGDVVFG
jgi:hypothetical protein